MHTLNNVNPVDRLLAYGIYDKTPTDLSKHILLLHIMIYILYIATSVVSFTQPISKSSVHVYTRSCL